MANQNQKVQYITFNNKNIEFELKVNEIERLKKIISEQSFEIDSLKKKYVGIESILQAKIKTLVKSNHLLNAQLNVEKSQMLVKDGMIKKSDHLADSEREISTALQLEIELMKMHGKTDLSVPQYQTPIKEESPLQQSSFLSRIFALETLVSSQEGSLIALEDKCK
jgi:hypothetical protein